MQINNSLDVLYVFHQIGYDPSDIEASLVILINDESRLSRA